MLIQMLLCRRKKNGVEIGNYEHGWIQNSPQNQEQSLINMFRKNVIICHQHSLPS